MRLNPTNPINTYYAARVYWTDEHVGDATCHVFIDPTDDSGRRLEPPVLRLLAHTAPPS